MRISLILILRISLILILRISPLSSRGLRSYATNRSPTSFSNIAPQVARLKLAPPMIVLFRDERIMTGILVIIL